LALLLLSVGCGGGDCTEEACGSGAAYLSCVEGKDFVVRDATTRAEFSRCTTDYYDPASGMQGNTDRNGCSATHAQSKSDFCAGAPSGNDDGGTGGTDGGYQPDRSCREDGTVCSCPNETADMPKTPVDSCQATDGRICCLSQSYCKCGWEQYSGSGCMFFGGINEDAFPTDSCTEAPPN